MTCSWCELSLLKVVAIDFPIPHFHGQVPSDIHSAGEEYVFAVLGIGSVLHYVLVPKVLRIIAKMQN